MRDALYVIKWACIVEIDGENFFYRLFKELDELQTKCLHLMAESICRAKAGDEAT